MVVNWTGGKPDREGYWVALLHFHDSDTQSPIMLDVYPNEDIAGTFIAYIANEETAYLVDDLFSDRLESTDTQGCKPVLFNTQNYTIRCATSPIQYKNVDWDYKYEEGE